MTVWTRRSLEDADWRAGRCIALCSLFGLLVGGGVAAQEVVTPPGFAATSGGRPSYWVGAFATGRMQFADAMLRGRGRKSIREVAYRRAPDAVDPATTGAGKSWREVRLSIAETEASSLSPVFATNPRTAPVGVFQGAVSWPTLSGRPATDPAPWSYRFPFQTPWLYSGTRDILLEYRFAGGALRNGQAWSTAQPVYSHAFDAARSATWRQGTVELFGSEQSGCRERAASAAAYCYLSSWFFARRTGDPRVDDKMFHSIYSRGTAPGAPVMHLLGTRGTELGSSFPGVGCNRLHVDTRWLLPTRAGASPLAEGRNHLGIVPYNPAVVGAQMWAQAAWEDSATGALRLSRAGRTTMVAQPPDPYPRSCVYYYDVGSPRGYGPESADYMNPVIRWSYQ